MAGILARRNGTTIAEERETIMAVIEENLHSTPWDFEEALIDELGLEPDIIEGLVMFS